MNLEHKLGAYDPLIKHGYLTAEKAVVLFNENRLTEKEFKYILNKLGFVNT